MLTYTENTKPKRKDRPWLLFILVVIWIFGTAFFHSPWEPYEPFVLAVVKGILRDHSWIVPYVSHAPYLEIQPFYFWIYAAILKLFNINDIYSIADSVRLINTLIIFAVVAISGRIGSNLSAYKNGRSVVLILISSIGFINNAYQLSPNILVLLGFCLYLYALQLHDNMPGISGWLLFIGLLFISINFTCEFILIALFLLAFLPCIDKHWRNRDYFLTITIGVVLFATIFFSYCYQLQQVNNDFFYAWKYRYTTVCDWRHYHFWQHLLATLSLLSWYVVPGWFLVIWSIYKRRLYLFKDKIIATSIYLALFLFIFTLISGRDIESTIFPIILPVAFIASLEIDSIRISIVSLLNWFAIFIFGVIGVAIWGLYLVFDLNRPHDLVTRLLSYAQDFNYNFNIWQLLLAILITVIWLFMITRRHIRGREVITNWASGTTFGLILFMALCLPWFDAVLTFKPIVLDSLKYIDKKTCIATNGSYTTQGALWYYYANVNLMPGFIDVDFSLCNQAVVATDNVNTIDQKNWRIVWMGRRPIDKKIYYVIKHK